MNPLTKDLAGDLFLFVIIMITVVWPGVAALIWRRNNRARHRARRASMARHPSAQPRRCDLTDCRQPAVTVFDLPGLPGSTFGACHAHAPKVAEWVGQPAYDQQQGGAA